jgi:hypothetical protein
MDDALLVRVLDGAADVDEERHAVAHGHGARSQNVIGSPWTNSIAKNGRPASVAPPSKTRAMPGSMTASACRSASKPGDHLARVHSELDDLERDAPLDRRRLLRE